MRGFQASFTRGEVSPLLHARTDLTSYMAGLKSLVNFIVLPQGGITRRPGFEFKGEARTRVSDKCPIRLIPFRYSSEDAMIVELSQARARFWTANGPVMKDGAIYEINTQYWMTALKDLKFVQSGNVLFLAHRDYPVYTLARRALDEWEIKEFEEVDGPWMPTNANTDDITITVELRSGQWCLIPSEDYFTLEMLGSLIRLDYTIEGSEIKGESKSDPKWGISTPVEVGGEWFFKTHGNWIGQVQIQKSLDGGRSWLTLRNYTRNASQDEGQLQMSGAETEKNVVYRIRAQRTGSNVMSYSLNVSGYVKSYIFRLETLNPDNSAYAERIWGDNPQNVPFPFGTETKTWELGAWNRANGYPGGVAFYQDRLVLGGSRAQPQTLWMSKTGDYKNFGMSDPIRDDDAINITLSADDMDGIHSIVAMSDVLIFTSSGEWKISGAGENGAISPKAVVAHQQTTIGSKKIQPLLVNNRVVFAQTHGTEVHALGYSLDQDGYSGSEISIMSQHLFEWKMTENAPPVGREVVSMDYQQVPDSLLWFVLEDGTAVTCTYQNEHEVVAWARQETNGIIGDVCCIPGDRQTDLWAVVRRKNTTTGIDIWGIERLASRVNEKSFMDAKDNAYESSVETLRINYDGQSGTMMPLKKLIPRVSIYTIRSKEAWVAPGSNDARNKRRKIKWDYSPRLSETDIQLDSGFERDANLQVWVEGQEPLTILAISPSLTPGG